MIVISRRGKPICSLEDWGNLAPPRGKDRHWVDGRSAKELGRAYFPSQGTPVVPKEVAQLLSSHPAFASVVLDEAIPEAVVHLDDLRGESRNTDLLILGHDDLGLW